MTSKEFWKNRSIANHKKALLLAENDIKELKKLMHLNLKDVQRQIKEFYDKYGEEPTKQLTLFEVDQYKKNLKSNCKKYPKSRTLKKAYIDDYPKYKITRLRAFETQLQTNIAYITTQQEKKIKVTLNQVARNGANLTAQMICEGLNFDFNALNNRILNKIVNEDWAGGGNWSKRIWGRCDNAAGKITDVLSRGLPQGKSLQSISSELCKATETSFNDAFRLVRTESGHILNQVHKESFLELQDEEGEKFQYEYCAYLDDRTSEICEEMNGKIFYYDDAVEGENFPPLHPNCRSCTVPVVENLKSSDNAIKDTMDKAKANEPLIREDLEAITKETGAELTGLEHSLKSEESIKNKVIRNKKEYEEQGVFRTDKSIASSFYDNVRYTQVTKNVNDLAGNIETTLTKLQDKGHTVNKIKNRWLINDHKNPYKDVMVQMVSPKGQKYELQFHDKHNLKLKKPLHEIYDKWRVEKDTVLKQQYTDEMNEIAKDYVKPEGIARITIKNIKN